MAGISRGQAWLLLALLSSALAGCQCFYPIPNEPIPSTLCAYQYRQATPEWALLPQQAKNHVYIYLLNGNDPLNTGNLLGVREYLHARGFVKTSYGQHLLGGYFEAEIAAVRQADPLARFLLVGFSGAAGPTNQMARRLGAQNVPIHGLVYLDGVFLFRPEEWVKPDNVERFVNVVSDGWLVHGQTRDGAENIHLPGTGHFDVPTHAETLRLLLHEATALANQVPVTVDVPPPPREGPRPTPLVDATIHHVPPEWEFLRTDYLGSGPWTVTTAYKPLSTAPKR